MPYLSCVGNYFNHYFILNHTFKDKNITLKNESWKNVKMYTIEDHENNVQIFFHQEENYLIYETMFGNIVVEYYMYDFSFEGFNLIQQSYIVSNYKSWIISHFHNIFIMFSLDRLIYDKISAYIPENLRFKEYTRKIVEHCKRIWYQIDRHPSLDDILISDDPEFEKEHFTEFFVHYSIYCLENDSNLVRDVGRKRSKDLLFLLLETILLPENFKYYLNQKESGISNPSWEGLIIPKPKRKIIYRDLDCQMILCEGECNNYSDKYYTFDDPYRIQSMKTLHSNFVRSLKVSPKKYSKKWI